MKKLLFLALGFCLLSSSYLSLSASANTLKIINETGYKIKGSVGSKYGFIKDKDQATITNLPSKGNYVIDVRILDRKGKDGEGSITSRTMPEGSLGITVVVIKEVNDKGEVSYSIVT